MVMALTVAGCSDGSSENEFVTGSSGGSGNSSGTGNSSEIIPEGFVKVKGETVTGKSNTNNYPSVL